MTRSISYLPDDIEDIAYHTYSLSLSLSLTHTHTHTHRIARQPQTHFEQMALGATNKYVTRWHPGLSHWGHSYRRVLNVVQVVSFFSYQTCYGCVWHRYPMAGHSSRAALFFCLVLRVETFVFWRKLHFTADNAELAKLLLHCKSKCHFSYLTFQLKQPIPVSLLVILTSSHLFFRLSIVLHV